MNCQLLSFFSITLLASIFMGGCAVNVPEGVEDIDSVQQPLQCYDCEDPPPVEDDPGGEPCGNNVCGAGEYCCNWSCGICAPEGGVCSQQFCGSGTR